MADLKRIVPDVELAMGPLLKVGGSVAVRVNIALSSPVACWDSEILLQTVSLDLPYLLKVVTMNYLLLSTHALDSVL